MSGAPPPVRKIAEAFAGLPPEHGQRAVALRADGLLEPLQNLPVLESEALRVAMNAARPEAYAPAARAAQAALAHLGNADRALAVGLLVGSLARDGRERPDGLEAARLALFAQLAAVALAADLPLGPNLEVALRAAVLADVPTAGRA